MFVLSTFLITIGLSNFCSLNPCFAVIFQSINILVTPLFKSAFTVMPLCISIFSTPMSSYTSLNILNVLLTFFYLSPSLTVPFRVSVHVPLYCAFPSVGYTTSLQFYYSFFFSTLYSGHKILLFYHSDIFFTIVSLFLHFIHSTLIIFSLFASSSLQFHASWYRLYVSYLFLKKESLSLIFVDLYPLAFISSTVYICYHYLSCYLFSL